MAKRNVDSAYAVVGVLEDMAATVSVLESYIPRFFAGLSQDVYRPKVNDNKSKPRLGEEARRLLEEFLADEIDFYHFCRQRLRAQYYALDLL